MYEYDEYDFIIIFYVVVDLVQKGFFSIEV